MNKADRFELFWDVYRPLNRQGKAMAAEKYHMQCKKYLTEFPSKTEEDFDSHVLSSLKAEIKYKKKQRSSGEFVPPWKQAKTYLYQKCYEDEFIDTPSSELQESSRFNCGVCGVECDGGGMCTACWDKKFTNTYSINLSAMLGKHKGRVPKTPDMSWYEWHVLVAKEFRLAIPRFK